MANRFTYLTNGQPFFFRGGPTGCLLIHGFTGTPGEMRWLGEYLAAHGHTVLGVRLTGHGTSPEDLSRASWQHWLGCAVDGWQILRGQCERVFVLGLSMGGMTAINIAAQFPVAGIVPMSTPIRLRLDWQIAFANVVAWVRPYADKAPLSSEKQTLRAPDHYSYPVWPVRAVKQFRDYMHFTYDNLPRVKTPALVVHSKKDDFVKPENSAIVAERLGSTDKEVLWLERSDHVVTEGPERQMLFDYIQAFVKAHGG